MKIRKLFKIILFTLIPFFIHISALNAENNNRIRLDWVKKFVQLDVYGKVAGTASVNFLSAYIKRDRLIFDVLIHNIEKEKYMCVFTHSAENSIHIDDELGNSYKGGQFSIANNMDNKFAPNQKKRVEISIPEPNREAKLVNIHLGFSIQLISGKPTEKCGSFIQNGEPNFHQPDWDISSLR